MASQSDAPLGALLGADEATLQQALPDLRKLPRPVSGLRATRGTWVLRDDTVAGLKFDTVFYFRARRLERIEQRSLTTPELCANQFDRVTAELDSHMGAGVRSSELPESGTRSAAWSMETYRVSAFQLPASGSCTVLLVHEPIDTKDASEL